MKSKSPKSITQFVILICLAFTPSFCDACTIVSAIGKNGQVWTANNEDGPFGVANFINVFPKSGNARYGYYTLSYLSPRYGQGANIQGGMNEAGLTFDFNAISYVQDFDPNSKKAYPDGNDAILTHLLGEMSSVEEVLKFFETYWFMNGFRSAQMHVSDKHGRFAIISASGIELVEKGEHLVSTNFDICGNEDGSYCWRYPLATQLLDTHGASLKTMTDICEQTAQKNGGTMYSNVQNLTTGEVWFFSKHDPGMIVNTTIKNLLAKGQRSYSFSKLNELVSDKRKEEWVEPSTVELSYDLLNEFAGTYNNSATGEITIKAVNQGIQVTFVDGMSFPLFPWSKNVFYLPEERVTIEFDTKEMTLKMHENGYWSFTAWKKKSGQ